MKSNESRRPGTGRLFRLALALAGGPCGAGAVLPIRREESVSPTCLNNVSILFPVMLIRAEEGQLRDTYPSTQPVPRRGAHTLFSLTEHTAH